MVSYNSTINDKDIIVSNIYKLVFNIPDFIAQWNDIEEAYKALGFNRFENDQKKIEDFIYINDCFYQFVVIKQEAISENIDNLDKLIELAKGWTQTEMQNKKEGWTPRRVVLATLRNAWINLIVQNILDLKELENSDKEE